MATVARAEEIDTLSSLEERILRAVQLVSQLRQEKDDALQKLAALDSEKTSAEISVLELQEQNAKLLEEVESLKAERKQVRTRIEKLIGQMDLLAGV